MWVIYTFVYHRHHMGNMLVYYRVGDILVCDCFVFCFSFGYFSGVTLCQITSLKRSPREIFEIAVAGNFYRPYLVHGGILWTHFPDNYPPSQIGSRVTVSASFQNIACLVDQLGQKYELVRVLTFSLGGNLRGGYFQGFISEIRYMSVAHPVSGFSLTQKSWELRRSGNTGENHMSSRLYGCCVKGEKGKSQKCLHI